MKFYEIDLSVDEHQLAAINNIMGRRVDAKYLGESHKFEDDAFTLAHKNDINVHARLLCVNAGDYADNFFSEYIHYPITEVSSNQIHVLDNDFDHDSTFNLNIDRFNPRSRGYTKYKDWHFCLWDNIDEETKAFLTLKYNIRAIEDVGVNR